MSTSKLMLSILLCALALFNLASAQSLRQNHGRRLSGWCVNGDWECTTRWWGTCVWKACKCKPGWGKNWIGRCTKDLVPCTVPETAEDIDLDEWVRASWYVQKQQVNEYQPANNLYCTTATYEKDNERFVFPGSGKPIVAVYNYANADKVNGEAVNTEDGQVLCARVPDKDDASKLLVAPCFLPNSLAGDYWIIAVGKDSEGKYEWAAVSGGKPTVKYNDGCTTKKDGINGSGLWVFTRKNVDPEGAAKAVAALESKGFTTSQLIDVPHAGCDYTGARIK